MGGWNYLRKRWLRVDDMETEESAKRNVEVLTDLYENGFLTLDELFQRFSSFFSSRADLLSCLKLLNEKGLVEQNSSGSWGVTMELEDFGDRIRYS
jgi:hypothetical protein